MMSIAKLYGHELRVHFPDSGARAVIDGRPVSFESLSVRSMNFGQHWRTPNIAEVSYLIELPLPFFVAFLAEEQLPWLIEEVKRDADPTEALDAALLRAGSPDAADAVRDTVLGQELAQYFAKDLLLHWLGDGPPDVEPGFVLNSVDRIHLCTTGLLLEGRGRVSGILVAYQDV